MKLNHSHATFFLLSFTAMLSLLWACAEVFDLPAPQLPPRITSIEPNKGGAGTLVAIEGANFSDQLDKNIVRFNGVEAVISSVGEQKIIAIVPENAGTGNVELIVYNQATTGPMFTYIYQPIIHSIDPATGPAGTEVVLKGRYFDVVAENNIVKFGGKTATVKSNIADSVLTVLVPVDAVSGNVTVTVHGETGIGPYFEFIEGNTPVHTITGIDPQNGKGGTAVKITGKNFDANPDANVVKFNGVQASVLSSSSTEIFAMAPENGSTGLVSVTINGLTANGPVFIYEDTGNNPVITDFNPKSGSVGTLVTITGQNFGNDNAAIAVKFNGIATSIQERDGTSSITVAVPQGATTGRITVTVNNATATSIEDFIVITGDPPFMATYPTSLRVRETFIITGTNFSNVPSENVIKINNFNLEVKSATTTKLEVYVSDGAASGSMSLAVKGVKAAYSGRGGETELDIKVNQWAPAGDLNLERHGHTSTLLKNGKVLVVGGKIFDNFQNSVEIYDPATNAWTHSGYLHLERAQHTATLLPNGKVLLVGGYSPIGVLHQCEIYDPATGLSTLTGHLNTPRALHSTVLLDDGKVLVVSGSDGVDNQNFGRPLLVTTCEIYNPATDSWSYTGSLQNYLMPTISLYSMSRYSSAVKLQNGKVLFAGFKTGSGSAEPVCEIFDPASGAWSHATAFPNPQNVLPIELVLLKNGDVLLSMIALDSKYNIYKPSSNSWNKVGNNVNWTFHETSTTVLDDGQVLMAGGYNAGGPTYFSKLLNPANGNANNEIGNIADRQWHAASKLADGTVLIAGGMDDFSRAMKRCEIFVPAK